MKKIVLFLSLLLIVGCQSTSGSSSFSPAVSNVQITKLAVLSPENTYVEDILVEELNKENLPAISGRGITAFATDIESLKKLLKQGGISHLLLINSQVGKQDMHYAGTVNNLQTNISSFGFNSISATTSGLSTPIYSSTNSAAAKAKLFSVEGNLLWVSDLMLEAQGTLYTGKKAMASGIADGFVDEMKKSKIISL
ncbi:hypothetical protein [Photobacterium leiognathi]|uniref:hypothetical protein n=1 Tax=Photobacterium leiognathi TaxID=553611 RepID=UPI0029820891|nr:hypothetical protein [Photobacterium leiognathi]